MNTYIVSYRRSTGDPTCTNIAMASSVAQVESHYGNCEWIHVNEHPKAWETANLRAKGAPVIDCRNYFDRRDYTAEVIDEHTKDGTDYSLVCYECGYLSIVTSAESSDDGMRLYYDEEIIDGASRYVLERWFKLIG